MSSFVECPACGSASFEQTTMGFSGHPFLDPNRATCTACKHSGNLGDWTRLRMYLRNIADGLGVSEPRARELYVETLE